METKPFLRKRLGPLLMGLAIGVAVPLEARPPMDFTVIGEPGNFPDGNGYGAVNYVYRITASRVSNEQYAEFLNAADRTGENPLRLYNPRMASSREGGIVYQPGNPDGRKYAIKDGFQDRPVLFVTWLDAARYSNWLCNGGGPLSSTETGAYDLIGSNGNPTHRRPGAKYWIPNENEWYKAAYYRVSPEGRRIYSREARWEDAHGSRTVSEIVDVSPPGENGLRFVAENERGRGAMPIEFDAVRGNDFARGFRVAAAADSGKSVVNLDKSILPVSEGPAVGVGPGIFFGAPFQNAIFTGEIQREAELPPSS